MALSIHDRKSSLEDTKDVSFDLIVVGGGITGAGVALDAVSRGLNVLLLEMQDYSSGTSSRSTKLIHGGLRYLRQYKFKMVRDVGRERHILRQNAPHLVWPEKMLVPVIDGGDIRRWQLKLGLWLYDYLAGVSSDQRHRMLSKSDIGNIEPLLDRQMITSGAQYYEFQTDDARLVISILKKADELGAQCFNYFRVQSFLYNADGKINGVVAKDELSGVEHQFLGRCVVNCTGPWVDDVREQAGALEKASIFHTKGVHIVVRKKDLPIHQPVYFALADGRMIFTIPRREHVYIGTTDTPYDGELKNPTVDPDDQVYLLKAINALFPSSDLQRRDIVSGWAGIRPLIGEFGKDPSQISRKDEIFEHENGLISIAGGKLSGYRLMAENIVDRVVKQLGRADHFGQCLTASLRLSGGEFSSVDQWDDFQNSIASKYENLPQAELHLWLQRYGKNVEHLLENMGNDTSIEAMKAIEMEYCKASEGVVNEEDFARRRTADSLFPIIQ